jgi:uncharacterized protein (TIGR02246 family)
VTTTPDEEQLLGLQQDYARHYDEGRPTEFAEAFTEDGRLVLPDGQTLAGRHALAGFAAAAAARPFRTHHFMTNQRVVAYDDRATGAAHVTAVSQRGDDVRLLVIGRYDDTMVRTEAGWRISERVISALGPEELG